jgi:hypothetical protein
MASDVYAATFGIEMARNVGIRLATMKFLYRDAATRINPNNARATIIG